MPVVYDSYTDVFGGSPVQPSNVAYSAIALTGNITLDWPQSYLDSPSIVTRIIDVISQTQAGWIITLPDATQVSVGQDFLITNRGTHSFVIHDASGNALLTVPVNSSIISGSTTLVAGQMDVDTALVQPGVDIRLGSLNTLSPANTGAIYVSDRVNGVSFTVTSENDTDNSTISYTIGSQSGAQTGSFYFYLTDNSTPAGTWYFVNFGAGTSGADASNLAGYGLTPFDNHLNTYIPITSTAVTPFTVDATYRANLTVWTGGAGICHLPDATTMLDGFYFALNNDGVGQLQIIPFAGQTIDSELNLILNPGASLYLTTDGNNWYTLGLGQPAVLNVSKQTYTLSNQNITVTVQEATSIEQFFIGTLTANVVVTYPPNLNYWFIYNNVTLPASAAYTVSVTVPGGTPIVIPNGARTIIYTDGLELYNTPTFIDGEFVRFPNGSAAAPSITFDNDDTTGLYLPAVGTLGLAAGGVEALSATAVTTTVHNAFAVTGASTFNNNLSITGTNTLTVGTGATILGGSLNVTGAVDLTIPLALIHGGTGANYASNVALFDGISPITTAGDLIYGITINTADRLAIGANNTFLVSNGTIPVWQALPAFLTPNVVTTDYTDTTNSFAAGTATTLFSATITPRSVNSNIQILIQVNVSLVGVLTPIAGLSLLRGSTQIYQGDTRGTNARFSVVCTGTTLQTYTISYIDVPGVTTAVTYNVGLSVGGAVGTVASINYDTTSATDTSSAVGASSIILTELFYE